MYFKVKHNTIKNIRESRNLKLEHASSSSGISVDDLSRWESADSEIELAQLKKLSKVYGKNWIAFLADNATKKPPVIHDTRIGQEAEYLDPEIILALEEAEANLQIANDLELGPKLSLPPRKETNPEELGAYFREFLEISFEAQKELTKDKAPFKFWTEIFNSKGIFVFQKSFKKKDIRAFSLKYASRAAITLNTEDTPKARVFSLFHELAHIYRNDTGLCNFTEKKNKRFSKEESYCNAFAAAFLMPLKDLFADPNFQKLEKNNLDPEIVKRISSTFQVSELVVYRRLNTINMLTLDEYLKIQASIMALYKSKAKIDDGRSGGGYYTTFFSHTGTAFISNVMDAYGDGKIGHRQIGRILGINSKLIPEVRERLLQRK